MELNDPSNNIVDLRLWASPLWVPGIRQYTKKAECLQSPPFWSMEKIANNTIATQINTKAQIVINSIKNS